LDSFPDALAKAWPGGAGGGHFGIEVLFAELADATEALRSSARWDPGI